MPDFIISKKYYINLKNLKTNKFKCLRKEDLRCFEYALKNTLNPIQKNSDKVSNYNYKI